MKRICCGYSGPVFSRPAFRMLLVCACLVGLLQGCSVKPNPINLAEHQLRVQEDRAKLYAGQEPLTGPLTLEMAVARAMKYNFDHRLALMEAAFHDQQLTSASYAMLPKLAVNAGYTGRDNESASSSISYETRKETLEPSVSSEKDRRTADLTLSWTVLDFGLSYFQAKQQADRVLIMRERQRRVLNNLAKEVIAAYWKAYAADQLLPLVASALNDSQTALDSYAAIYSKKLSPPLETLEQQRDLFNIISQLRRIQSDLTMSRLKLAALINVPLHEVFTLAPPAPHMMTPPPLAIPVQDLEDKGLALRADLREEAYQERIDKAEVHKEILRMLPGVSLTAGYNYDSNRFLVHETWSEVGARATMSLLNLITGPMQIQAAETKVDVTRTRRLAQTVAALVQINLAYHQYRQALDDYQYSKEIGRVEKEIYAIVQREHTYAAQSRLGLIRRSVSVVRTQIDHARVLTDLYMFWGNMYFSLGGDIVPREFARNDLGFMAQAIRDQMDRWWRGELPFEGETLQTGGTTQVGETPQKDEIVQTGEAQPAPVTPKASTAAVRPITKKTKVTMKGAVQRAPS